MKIWKILFYILAVIQLPFIVSLLTFYFKARQVLGYAPSYSNPDPKELEIYKIFAPLVEWTAGVWICSLTVWFVLTTIYLFIMRKRIEWTPLIISGTVQFFGIILLFSGIVEWYLD